MQYAIYNSCLLFINDRKVAAAPALADGAFQHNLLAKHLFDHAALHRADAGVLLGDIKVRAGKQLEAIVLGPQLDWDAAPLQRRTERLQALGQLGAGGWANIFVGQTRADGVEQHLQPIRPFLAGDLAQQHGRKCIVLFREQALRSIGEKVKRMWATGAAPDQPSGYEILGLQMRQMLADSGGADPKQLLELLDSRLAVALQISEN